MHQRVRELVSQVVRRAEFFFLFLVLDSRSCAVRVLRRTRARRALSAASARSQRGSLLPPHAWSTWRAGARRAATVLPEHARNTAAARPKNVRTRFSAVRRTQRPCIRVVLAGELPFAVASAGVLALLQLLRAPPPERAADRVSPCGSFERRATAWPARSTCRAAARPLLAMRHRPAVVCGGRCSGATASARPAR